MIVLLFLILYSNTFEVQNDIYRIPDYSLNTYRKIYSLNVKEDLNINYKYFLLKTYFNIYRPTGFNEDNKDFQQSNLQALQFQFEIKFDFLELSAGRILDFENYDAHSFDGAKLKFYIKNFSLSYSRGKNISSESFLGYSYFYETNFEKEYDINSINLTFDKNNNSLKLTYNKFDNDNSVIYENLKSSVNLNLMKLKIFSMANYLFNTEDFERIFIDASLFDLGITYETYKPFFINDNIFNIFVVERYKRGSIYYQGKNYNVSLFSENNENTGFTANIFLMKKTLKFKTEYLNKDYLFLSAGKTFKLTPQKYFKTILNYYLKQNESSSYALRMIYQKIMMSQTLIKLYADFIYNTYYNFQMRAGFYFISGF